MQASVLLRIPKLSLPSNAYNTAHESCLPFKIWMPLIRGGVAYSRQSRTTGNLCVAGQGPLNIIVVMVLLTGRLGLGTIFSLLECKEL